MEHNIKKMIKDNFLHKDYFNNIKKHILGFNFPWFIDKVLSNKTHKHMTHSLYQENEPNSNYYRELFPLLNALKCKSLIRMKFNLTFKTDKIIEHGYHVDEEAQNNNMKTSILYMNTNNGYTGFKTGEKFGSKENRLVTFDGHRLHTGTTNSCEQPYRCVLNINYY